MKDTQRSKESKKKPAKKRKTAYDPDAITDEDGEDDGDPTAPPEDSLFDLEEEGFGDEDDDDSGARINKAKSKKSSGSKKGKLKAKVKNINFGDAGNFFGGGGDT